MSWDRAVLQQKVATEAAAQMDVETLRIIVAIQTQKDLEHIGDYDLIKTAEEMGLLTDDEVDELLGGGF